MASYNTNLKNWGATGSEYPDGYDYVEGEQPVDEWDNFLTNNIISDIKDHLIPLTNSRVESAYGTAGGEPGTPEASHLYHDQDNERLELWDAAAATWRDIMFRDGDTMTGALDMGNYPVQNHTDLVDNNGKVIWNYSAGYIPQGRLQNDSVTVAGNAVSLGASTAIAHADLSDAPSSAHHTRYADSEAVSAVNAETSLNVDITGDADTVDGNHASAFASSGHTHSELYNSGLQLSVDTAGNTSIAGELTENASL